MTDATTTVRHRSTAFGQRAHVRAHARDEAAAEAAERIAERIAGRVLGILAHLRSSHAESDVSQNAGADDFNNGFNNGREAEDNSINFGFRHLEPTYENARWLLTSSERKQIRQTRVLHRASAMTPARHTAHMRRTRVRPRGHRSHRVVRVAKTAGGDSGDPDPEPEPPTTRHTATIGGVS